jgi:hypothetical protein
LGRQESASACKLPILYIEDSGGCYSDLPLFSSLCPQLVIGKTVGSGHFPTLEVPEQVNSMIEHFIKAYLKKLKGPSSPLSQRRSTLADIEFEIVR